MIKRNLLTVCSIIVIVLIIFSCSGRIKDQDGNTYSTVKIGDQEWMAENLNVITFMNGDPIPEAKTLTEWYRAGANEQPAWCYYNYDPENGKIYGKLYNGFAITDSRGISPKGWHVPSNEEWIQLIDKLGGFEKAGRNLKSTKGWSESNGENGNGNNSSGFNGLPGGFCQFNGEFAYIREYGQWASSSVNSSNYILNHFITNNTDVISESSDDMARGFSVRCVKSEVNDENEVKEDTNKPEQPSVKMLLDLNLRDLSGMKSVLGKPFYEDGDAVGWEYDDFEIEYQVARSLILVKLKNNIAETKKEFDKYINVNPNKFEWYYKSKVVRVYNDRIQIEYGN